MQHKISNSSSRPQQPRRSWRARLGALCAATLMSISGMGWADADHDRARRALEAGEVLPLGTILTRLVTLPLESVSHNRDHELACLG
ncbi:hypothetical protein [Rhodoferax sp.]|uniref:hypothetical protein n=1 Tax=Rhodoferax sp. TaxID=50421 RepID=UPI00271AE43C|nr:hypothetical protein [Rhodoferax sp.]MDO9144496.1 hypothetical protein [Rhodoferax sp.]